MPFKAKGPVCNRQLTGAATIRESRSITSSRDDTSSSNPASCPSTFRSPNANADADAWWCRPARSDHSCEIPMTNIIRRFGDEDDEKKNRRGTVLTRSYEACDFRRMIVQIYETLCICSMLLSSCLFGSSAFITAYSTPPRQMLDS